MIALLLYPQRARLEEYREHFFGNSKSTFFSVSELSEEWTEATVRQRFAEHPVWCGRYQGDLPVDRACGVKIKSYNGIPALYLALFFKDAKLQQMAISLPWWAQGKAYRNVVAEHGAPSASQPRSFSGVRLHGWRLPDGGGLFLNRDRPFNPLDTNAIYWRSATECRTRGCFSGDH
ncbi:hypothetical protein [Variovorax sp. TBS-050B]|uniref:hypothetical protein n=1 Tax=Variovorax sp. TBS-050B TaxID=2940551 RepID=UPI002474CC67|nr:hypothetical protein [Variovorax sp. TBS-050B]